MASACWRLPDGVQAGRARPSQAAALLLTLGASAAAAMPAMAGTSCSVSQQNINYPANYHTCTTDSSGDSSVVEQVAGPADNGITYTNNGTVSVNGNSHSPAAVAILSDGTPMSSSYKTYIYLSAPEITVVNNGKIDAKSDASFGILALSEGAPGVEDGQTDDTTSAPNNHYMGRNGGTVSVTHNGEIDLGVSSVAPPLSEGGLAIPLSGGIYAQSVGGGGGVDGGATDHNGPGGNADTVTVVTSENSSISVTGNYAAGILAGSVGGDGPGYSQGTLHNFDSGGDGGKVSVTHAGKITGTATGNVGIYAASVGGASGATDSQYSERGGNAGEVDVTLKSTSSISVSGDNSTGVFASSVGGLSWYANNSNSGNHRNGNGGAVNVTTESGATITTSGKLSVGIVAASTGGNANTTQAPPYSRENGGSANAVPTTRAPAGNAGAVDVTNAAAITTNGDSAVGIAAVSATGGRIVGALSGSGGTIDQVGEGSGTPSTVEIDNSGTISTNGTGAIGLLGLSVGGPGGVLDTRGGLLNLLGDNTANPGVSGSTVTINHAGDAMIQTRQAGSVGILAASIGGGGGVATGTGGIFAVGSNGGAGGNGGTVTVDVLGDGITTAGDNSIGIVAQSIGGGGGQGGNATGIVASVGGGAGSGGNGGTVTVTVEQASGKVLATSGDFAIGVLAQSIGGGGGNGGGGKTFGELISVPVGGDGGSGGTGATVTGTQKSGSTIHTTGASAHGMLLQSIGGGGGNGGSANAKDIGFGFSVNLAFGGSGSAAGSAATVTATNDGTIRTEGMDSIALLAQSVGGGGGNGGATTAKAIAISADEPEIPTIGFSVSHGGNSAVGGSGGEVDVTQTGTLQTGGDGAHAILAQSVGGGGGNGGDSSAAASNLQGASFGLDLALSFGGKGGGGGGGGKVTVKDSGSIGTGGADAMGILAQSIGGSGGNGGMGNAKTGSEGTSDEGSVGITFSMGGKAGDADPGGEVDITASGKIATSGSGSVAILAQSIGGGGGQGGGGGASGSGDTVDVNVTVGADGGSGNHGGTVNVTFDGSGITTSGGDAVGILAQSIGGGGGVAGTSDAKSTTSGDDDDDDGDDDGGEDGGGEEASTLAAAADDDGGDGEAAKDAEEGKAPAASYDADIAVGGKGGTGSDGGKVTVSSTGNSIATKGARAYGILAHSIGGGGGSGGSATGASNAPDKGKAYAAIVSVGGKGSAAGNGGEVDVSVETRISTAGYGAHGLMLQSIGGGGGVGADGTVNNSATIGLGAGVSGDGGAAGTGGLVSATLESSGSIETIGDDAFGVLAHSIGGGGGTGSASCSNSASIKNETATLCYGNVGGTAAWGDNTDITLKIGGTSGASGDGGKVDVDHSGTIVTYGARAFGIAAQSIGGGGGLVSASATNLESTQLQWNAGQNYAKGGEVDVTIESGASVTTYGDGAWGILAQSIGGGGGFAGDPSLALVKPISNTLPDHANSSNHYPDSGQVTVEVKGDLTTYGANAHGIFAQAIGGGGGIAAGVDQSAGANVVAGNSAQLYNLSSTPQYAGEAMEVTITQASGSRIDTSGAGSIAIIAQASGKNNYQRPITITVDGSVTGGKGNGAAGILVSGGGSSDTNSIQPSNTITVGSTGSVSTADGTDGTAIETGYGLTHLVNSGTITGSILLGSTAGYASAPAAASAARSLASTFAIEVAPEIGRIDNDGTIVSGARIVTSRLTNSGTLDIGGVGDVAGTRLEGDLRQTGTGRLLVDVDHLAGTADALEVTGDADLAGEIGVSARHVLPGTLSVLTAGRLTSTARSADALVVGWDTAVEGNQLTVTSKADFTPEGVALGRNEGAIASHLQSIWDRGGTGDLARLFGAFSEVQDEAELRDAYRGLSASSLATNAIQQTSAAQAALGAALSCPVDSMDAGTIADATRCIWMSLTTGDENLDASDGMAGFRVDRTTYRAGVQGEVADGWKLGFTAGYSNVSTRSDPRAASGNGDAFDVGAALMRQIGRWQLGVAVDAGYGWYDDSRNVTVGSLSSSLDSSPDVLTLGGRLRAAYELPLGTAWYLRPYADLDLIYSHVPSYEEKGDDALALDVRSTDRTLLMLSPMVELGGVWALDATTRVQPYIAFGATLPSDDSWSTKASLAGADGGSFSTVTRTPDVIGNLDLGVRLYQAKGFELKAEYGVRVGDDYRSQFGGGRAAFRF